VAGYAEEVLMDEIDMSQNVKALEETLEPEFRMVAIDTEAGLPTASTIKRLFHEEYKQDQKRKISKAEQAILNEAWSKRVRAKRALDDCDNAREIVALKKNYFQSIEDYKTLYNRIMGE
jgi:hypothetical protein